MRVKGREEGKVADREEGGQSHDGSTSYLRFGAMIATSMVVMYGVTYLSTFELSHVYWSEMRIYMTLLMGATMGVIMLGFMLGMFPSKRINAAILLGALAVFGLAAWLVRSQAAIEDDSYLSAMIPHHSIAILTSERSEIEDLRVCELAVAISEAQRREIEEMRWLIEDIEANGPALSDSDADARAIPEFTGTTSRSCSTNS